MSLRPATQDAGQVDLKCEEPGDASPAHPLILCTMLSLEIALADFSSMSFPVSQGLIPYDVVGVAPIKTKMRA